MPWLNYNFKGGYFAHMISEEEGKIIVYTIDQPGLYTLSSCTLLTFLSKHCPVLKGIKDSCDEGKPFPGWKSKGLRKVAKEIEDLDAEKDRQYNEEFR